MYRAECGIDYLTCTLPLDSDVGPTLVAIGYKLMEEEKSNGNTFKEARLLGYDGAKCGSVFAGAGGQGYILRISGSRAMGAIPLLRALSPQVTRIDLQVTVWYPAESDLIIRQQYGRAYEAASIADRRARRTVTRWEDNSGGYTFYIGSRHSSYFGRVYDKHKESKDDVYTQAIRYEVELKGEAAEKVFRLLRHGKTVKEAQIVSFVAEWYLARGVRADWTYEVGLLDVTSVKRETSDTERRLKWLRTQVRHTCMLLRETVDATVILEALGFFEPVPNESGERYEEVAAKLALRGEEPPFSEEER